MYSATKSVLKDIFLGGLAVSGLPRSQASILMYHSISSNREYFANVSQENFHSQMKFLAKSGKSVVPLRELVRRLLEGKSLQSVIAITFDDGYLDNYQVAFPILKSYGFHFTVFVETGLIGGVDSHGMARISEKEIKEMDLSGLVDIAPHTVTHPKLTTLSLSEAEYELRLSKECIESITGGKASLFAYPFGNHDDCIVNLAKKVGFDAAVTVQEGTVSKNSNPFRLPRNSIDSSTTLPQFAGKISRAIDLLAHFRS